MGRCQDLKPGVFCDAAAVIVPSAQIIQSGILNTASWRTPLARAIRAAQNQRKTDPTMVLSDNTPVIDCEHWSDGKCRLVSEMSGLSLEHCTVGADACRACLASASPSKLNSVTASLAIGLARRHLPADDADAVRAKYVSHLAVIKREPKPAIAPKGPGTELKKLLSRLGFGETRKCNCASHAREMDHRGVDWCRANVETIVDWLRQEAETQGLCFVPFVARMLILYAIRRASK